MAYLPIPIRNLMLMMVILKASFSAHGSYGVTLKLYVTVMSLVMCIYGGSQYGTLLQLFSSIDTCIHGGKVMH